MTIRHVGQHLRRTLVCSVLVSLPALTLACGWWGDGEDSGPEAVAVDAQGNLLDSQAAETPEAKTREGNRLMKFGFSGYAGAARLYRQAAMAGYAPAQNNLGMMYEQGLGVAPDLATAAHWYQLAAEGGEPHAQHSLGNFYLKGTGVEQDKRKGFEWIEASAMQGHPSAVAQLSELYQSGEGTEPNPVKAMAWALVAERLGKPRDAESVRQLAATLNRQQLVQAREMAKNLPRVMKPK